MRETHRGGPGRVDPAGCRQAGALTALPDELQDGTPLRLATGETARKRTIKTVNELTAQEVQIARLARNGRSNPEISTQLFISPRTVEWHLGRAFAKLGISSRRELRAALPDLDLIPVPA